MADEPPRSVRSLFNEAAEIGDPARRAFFLDRACGSDRALRRRVEALLVAAAEAGEFLAEAAAPADNPAAWKIGDRIGRYLVQEKIGEGGCGLVYLAEQLEPVRRQVALKVIKLGMDTESVMARFEAERQALALMDHPGIAKVFDAGATEAGRPYFVMELVRGTSITDYCDRHNLNTADRLQLFARVCHAVQHAHQKGIVHRDLKPSNILVTPSDSDRLGDLKVIDFGIAKATGAGLTEHTLVTAINQFIGTPAYMSPEQAGLSGLDIDTRSDIYSLGVLLYELLTGRTPFDARDLLQRGFEEMLRTLREDDPPRPSTQLTRPPPARADGPRHPTGREASSTRRLLQDLRGDLDWIVMKCLEKDRSRRYQTANGLAMDIERHLRREPVAARPPSLAYRIRKLVHRNRAAVAATLAIAAALILGAAASTWQAVRATRAEQGQSQLRQEAEERLYDSLVGEARATRMARQSGYRADVFALLRQALALDVAAVDRAALRREATACLGDFVGLAPAASIDFPADTSISFPSSVRVDPTGALTAFSLSDGSILLCETTTGLAAARLRTTLPVWRCGFAPDGRRLFSVHLPSGGELTHRIAGAVLCTWMHSPDAGWMKASEAAVPGAIDCVTIGERPLVIVWNEAQSVIELKSTPDLEDLFLLPSAAPPYLREFFALPIVSADSKWFACQVGRDVHVWDLPTGQPVAVLDIPEMGGISSLCFSADGTFLAVSSGRGCVIYQMNSSMVHVASLSEGNNGRSQPSFDAEGRIALPSFRRNQVLLWDALRTKELAFLEVPFGPYKTAFSNDGRLLVVAGLKRAGIFQVAPGPEKRSLSGHRQGVPGVRFSPDGTRIASVSSDMSMRMWNARTGEALWNAPRLPNQGGFAIDWSPDGRFLATAHWSSQQVWIWNAESGEPLQKLRTSNPTTIGGVGWSVRFTPDGKYLLAAHTPDARTAETVGLTIWPVDSESATAPIGPVVQTLRGEYHNLTISPDSRHAAFMNFYGDPQLRSWEFLSAAPPRILTENIIASRQNANFGENGRALVYLDQKRNVVVCDSGTGAVRRSFPTLPADPPEGWDFEPQFLPSPDGTMVAMTSVSKRGVEIWDLHSGRLVIALPEQSADIEWLDWAPDCLRLAVSRSDGELAIWDLAEVERILTGLGLGL